MLSEPMHFPDPTVDWPRDLLGEEVPDLLYLKSNDPLNLSIQLHYPNTAGQISLMTPWIEYRSLDSSQSVAILFIDSAQVLRDSAAEQEIATMLQHLKTLHIEVGRYRKIKTTYKRDESSIGPESYIWSWAFRPLSEQQLRSCLTTFESFSTTLPICQAARQTTTYGRLLSSKEQQAMSSAPAALIVHHVDGSREIAEQPRFSQEMLYDHSVLEKTILGAAPAAQFNDVNGGGWQDPVSMMLQAPL